jgi:hypothetical protein
MFRIVNTKIHDSSQIIPIYKIETLICKNISKNDY